MSFIERGNLETCKHDVQTDNSNSENEKNILIPLFEDDAPFWFYSNYYMILQIHWIMIGMSFIKRGNLETCKRDVQTDNSHSENEKNTLIPLFEDDAPF